MHTASTVIEMLGGAKAVGDIVGLTRNAVQRWTYAIPDGSGNVVPPKHWVRLVEYAQAVGKPLTLQDLAPDHLLAASAEPRRRKRVAA